MVRVSVRYCLPTKCSPMSAAATRDLSANHKRRSILRLRLIGCRSNGGPSRKESEKQLHGGGARRSRRAVDEVARTAPAAAAGSRAPATCCDLTAAHGGKRLRLAPKKATANAIVATTVRREAPTSTTARTVAANAAARFFAAKVPAIPPRWRAVRGARTGRDVKPGACLDPGASTPMQTDCQTQREIKRQRGIEGDKER